MSTVRSLVIFPLSSSGMTDMHASKQNAYPFLLVHTTKYIKKEKNQRKKSKPVNQQCCKKFKFYKEPSSIL
jgi:hypothetical protein